MANVTPPMRIPPLEGWMTLSQAARELRLTSSRVHKMVMDGLFPGTRFIGDEGHKPIYIIPTGDVLAEKARRARAHDPEATGTIGVVVSIDAALSAGADVHRSEPDLALGAVAVV